MRHGASRFSQLCHLGFGKTLDQIPDSRFQNSAFTFAISDFRVTTFTDCNVLGFIIIIAGFKLQIPDFRFRTEDFRFQISDFFMRISECHLQIGKSRIQVGGTAGPSHGGTRGGRVTAIAL